MHWFDAVKASKDGRAYRLTKDREPRLMIIDRFEHCKVETHDRRMFRTAESSEFRGFLDWTPEEPPQ